MLLSAVPPKFNIPFGNAAGGSYIRSIPQASQIGIQDGAASLTDGFPPWCFNPGGAPFGQDFNGLLKQVTQWSQWQAAGGSATFDGTFSSAVGGYPQGAILASATQAGISWLSLVDNNTVNPDSGPSANWAAFASITGVQNQQWVGFNDTGSADALVITPSPAPVAYVGYQKWAVKKGASPNATTTPTLNVGGLGAKVIKNADGTAVTVGQLVAGMIFEVTYDGTAFRITSFSSPQAVIKSAVFPHFIATNNTNFTSSTLLTDIPYTGYSAAIGDPNITAAFNLSNSLFTCPTGYGGFWCFQGYANSLASGSTPSAGNGQRMKHNSTYVSISTSPDSVIVQNQVSAFFNMADGDTVQFFNFFEQTGVTLSYFYFTGVRLGLAS